MSGTRLWKCYEAMKDRVRYYPNWVNKGIKICDEWRNNPSSFFEWAMKNGYTDSLTLDRIDVYGNYEPSNCRWITKREQQNNKTNTRWVTINGERKTISEWSQISGLPYSTIAQRVRAGYAEEDLLKSKRCVSKEPTRPISKYSRRQLITIKGETKTIKEWSEISGVSCDAIILRYIYGWSDEKLLIKSQRKGKEI